MPDLDKLGAQFGDRRSVLVGSIDCQQNPSVCGKYSVVGYPTLKGFKKEAPFKALDYNGARDFASMAKFVEEILAGPECSLDNKDLCTKEQLRILEASEAMPAADRSQKIAEMEAVLAEKSSQAQKLNRRLAGSSESASRMISMKKSARKLDEEATELRKILELYKLGGERADKVAQLVSDANFREHCGHRTCVLAFLPPADGGERGEMLDVLDVALRKAKADGFTLGFMWIRGGDQPDVEKKLGLQPGFPKVIAMNLKKGKFVVKRKQTLDRDTLGGFISSLMMGKVGLTQLPSDFEWGASEPLDGEDGASLRAEEL